MIRVIHIRNADFDNPTDVYIGRKNARRAGSPLGNPEWLRDEVDRAANIARYRRWLLERLVPGSPQLAEIERLRQVYNERGELNLVCYCAPKACHGDVIKTCLEGADRN